MVGRRSSVIKRLWGDLVAPSYSNYIGPRQRPFTGMRLFHIQFRVGTYENEKRQNMKSMRSLFVLALITLSTFSFAQNSSCIIGDQCLASGPSEKALKEMNTVCNAQDENGLKSLIASSQAYVLSGDTRISVVNRSFATSEIIVQSGTYKGVRMRISNEYFNCE